MFSCVSQVAQSCASFGRSVTDDIVLTCDEWCPIFMDAIRLGQACLIEGWEGRSVDPITDLSVGDRILNIALGILLLIPLINIVVFSVFKLFVEPDPASSLEGMNLAFLTPDIQFPASTPEKCSLRKQTDLPLLQYGDYQRWTIDGARYQQVLAEYRRAFAAWEAQVTQNSPPPPEMPRWIDVPDVTCVMSGSFMNRLLNQYSSEYQSPVFAPFRDFLTIPQRDALEGCLVRHDRSHRRANRQNDAASKSLARLNDFLIQRWREYQGTQHETAFKQYVAAILSQIIDAHENCIDQVNAQLETLLVRVVISWEATRAGRSATDRLEYWAQYECLKYCLNLVKQACIVEYPNQIHVADLERHVKTELCWMGALGSEITTTGSILSFGSEVAPHIANVVFLKRDDDHIPDRSQRERNPALYDARLKLHREGCRYEPVQYLVEELRVPHGEMRTLRNQILMLARQYYGLEADDELTRAFVAAISADPDLPADEGGALTYGAIVLFLERLGILRPRSGLPENGSGVYFSDLSIDTQSN